MARRVRTYETDHPYALQSWEGRFPQLIPGDGTNDELRVRAPKSYWLTLEANYPDYQNKDGFSPVDVMRRDLNGTNGCPLLGESFKTRMKKTISALRKTFLSTDWHEKGAFKMQPMWISIKRHDFVSNQEPTESPSTLTPPPRYGPQPPPEAMFHHFPKYDDPAADALRPDDELQWDALLGIPQIGCESIIAACASNSSDEIATTTNIQDIISSYGPADYGDITAGIVL